MKPQPTRSASMILQAARVATITGLLLGLSACDIGTGNGDHHYLRLDGDISLGQHLIDLKRARDEGAITAAEFEGLKAHVLDMTVGACPDSDDQG